MSVRAQKLSKSSLMSKKHKEKRGRNNLRHSYYLHSICRYLQNAPTSWIALTTAFFVFVIGFLVGYMIYGAGIHIVKVEDDFKNMQELKVRAEAADVAKSQVSSQDYLFLVKYLNVTSKFLAI